METLPGRGYRFLAPVEGVAAQTNRVESIPPKEDPETIIRRQRVVLIGLAAAFAVAALAPFLSRRSDEPSRTTPLRRFAIVPPEAASNPAISPNSRHVAYIAGDKLWIQDLDREHPRVIEGTGGALGPFWSPDSEFVGFHVGTEIKKVAVQGGPAITLCQMSRAGDLFSAAWSADGASIVFSALGGLYEVPARGGTPEQLIEASESEKGKFLVPGLPGAHGRPLWPHFLPPEAASRALLFSFRTAPQIEIVLQNLETGKQGVLATGFRPFYSPSGHVLYQSAHFFGTLFALPFSIESLKPTGAAFPIAEDAGLPSVAVDGTMVYLDFTGVQKRLLWRDRGGNKLGVIGQPQKKIGTLSLSPDGRFVAVEGIESASGGDVWIHDVARSLKTRLTLLDAHSAWPVWSPDGTEIAFVSLRAGSGDVFIKSVDGIGEAKALLAMPLWEGPTSWSQDGKYLVANVTDPKTGEGDIWYLERQADGSFSDAVPYLQGAFYEGAGQLSPDGRHLAYVSNSSGQPEVYVQRFPEGGGTRQVSTNGGTQPRWSEVGSELFYVRGDALMVVSVTTDPTFSAGTVRELFSNPNLAWEWRLPTYDVSADGKRFVLAETLGEPVIRVVENWYEEFRNREQD